MMTQSVYLLKQKVIIRENDILQSQVSNVLNRNAEAGRPQQLKLNDGHHLLR